MGSWPFRIFCDCGVGQHAYAQHLELRGGVGVLVQAVLFGLRGHELHADHLVEHLVLLLGGQFLLLALQQTLHVNVEFGARYRGAVDDGDRTGARRRLVRGRGGRRLLSLAARRQHGDGEPRWTRRSTVYEKIGSFGSFTQKKATLADLADAPGAGSLR